VKTAKLKQDEPLAGRVERLEQELALALRWDRPSILLAVYASEFVRAEAGALLEAWLREQGQAVARVQVAGPADPVADVPRLLREWPDRDRTVFFVSGLRQGAPTTWNALNVRREYLVADRIRAVFWLTEREASELPRRAPDFWAFRHWVVEFLESPEVGRAVRMAGELAWTGFERHLAPEERRARIAFRERLLSELPDAPETAAARAQLRYTLGGLYFFGREYEAALGHMQAVLDLARQVGDARLEVWALNGLGAVYSDLRRSEEAIAAYRRAIELDPNEGAPHNGLGNVYRDLGRSEEAIAAYRRAIELDPEEAIYHNNLGNVYSELGRSEEAIAAYRRAIELDPEEAVYHNNLGIVYSDLGRSEEAIAAYRRAIELDPDDATPHVSLAGIYRHLGDKAKCQRHLAEARRLLKPDAHYNLACVESIAGNVDAALDHLSKALEKAPRRREWARRDPDLAFIRDHPRFRELVGITSDREIHDQPETLKPET
jgi:tetratricopeptide (TPR) repeat protein